VRVVAKNSLNWRQHTRHIKLTQIPHIVKQDTVTGFLLAGIGHRTVEGSNFLVVKPDTDVRVIEQTFHELTTRKDIGILLINQHVANEIRSTLRDYSKLIPTILEIPSKDIPYDAEKDYIMQRVSMVLGGGVEEK